MMPFWQWKDEQIKTDSAANGGVQTFRLRDWYYRAYGRYCAKYREANNIGFVNTKLTSSKQSNIMRGVTGNGTNQEGSPGER